MKSKLPLIVFLSALSMSIPFVAQADDHWHGARGDRHDIRRFYEHDIHRWATGHWVHGIHGGRIGWWWVVGATVETALWYPYATPVYPYPDPYVPPTTVVIQSQPAPPPQPATPVPPPAAASSWYFCTSSGKYYPYTQSCPEGWKTVPAIPPAP